MLFQRAGEEVPQNFLQMKSWGKSGRQEFKENLESNPNSKK